MKRLFIYTLLASSVILNSCGKDNPGDDTTINIFSVEDDIALGKQVSQQIESDTTQFKILSPAQYPEAYTYINKIRDKILNSGKVFYKDKFEWSVKIVHNDSVLNAFAAPGGYIYFYTGLIKYLDAEYQLAGVMGHEMAHADLRHSTDQLTKLYGIQLLFDVVLGGDPGTIAQIAASLATLKFSRSNEEEADDYSVIYLCPTDYQADGAAYFFQKLIDRGNSGNPPVFLSTHPDPGNRVQDIKNKRDELNCAGTATYDQEYQAFKNSLPQ